MTAPKIQNLRSLREEMKSVARGDKPAPRDAAEPSFESVETLVRLLTPGNRSLLAAIRDTKPRSVAELAAMTGRAPSNLTRTLGKLEAAGLVRMISIGRRKAPRTLAKRILVEIDPFGGADKLKIA